MLTPTQPKMSHFWLSYRNHFSSMQRTLRKRKKEKEEGLFKRNMQTAANTKLCKLQMNFLHFANWYMKSSNCFLIGYGLLPLLLQTPEHLFLDEQTLAFLQFFIVQWWFATTTGHSSWRVKLAEINFFSNKWHRVHFETDYSLNILLVSDFSRARANFELLENSTKVMLIYLLKYLIIVGDKKKKMLSY